MTDRPRVVFLCGGPGADVRYLEIVDRHLDLVVYRSRWLQPGVRRADLPAGIPERVFDPVVRSHRGHLVFRYRGLHAALDRDLPDVIHVLSEPWGLLAVQAASWVRAHPATALVLHGCDTIWHHGGRLEQLVRRALLRHTLPVTAAFAAESEKALAVARANGLPERSQRVMIHTNPRDPVRFHPPTLTERVEARGGLGLAEDELAVGLLARLVPEKGVRLLLGAADILRARGLRCCFLIAGDGPLADEVSEHGNPTVRLLGRLDYPTGVVGLCRAIDIIACPSLTTPYWEDQGPRSLLEAMMCGCVPVGTRTGAIAEMLPPDGVLATDTTAEALADAVMIAAKPARDPSARARISTATTARYSAEAVAGRLVELWSSLTRTDDTVPRSIGGADDVHDHC